MVKIISLVAVFLLSFESCLSVLKNGDIREFYVSAKNLPHATDGTGNYLYAFVTGTLTTGGNTFWDKEVYSNLTVGPNPIWSSDLRNITYKNSYSPSLGFGQWGDYKIAIFERLTNGKDKLMMGLWHDDIKVIEYVDESCRTKQPYEVKYFVPSYYNYTYYYHCTRSFS